MAAIDNLIVNKYGSNCVAYWPLTKDGVALKGGVDLTLSNVTFTKGMADFNGSNSSGSSASAINLSTYNKITVVFSWYATSYDLTNDAILLEFNTAWSTNGGFGLYSAGSNAGDPLRVVCFGNVGANTANYNDATFSWSTPKKIFLTATYDFSQTTNEVQLYSNGALISPDGRLATSNNTGNFGNYTLFVGARNNASSYVNSRISNVAIFNKLLTDNEIKELYMSIAYDGYQSLPLYMILDDGERKRGYRFGD